MQQQWRQHLGIDVQLVVQDFSTYLRTTTNLQYNAVAHSFDSGYYLDPNWFLSQFMTGSSYSGTGWSDPKYDLMLNRANELIVPAERMHALASCERYLLAAMPVVPIYFDAWSYLQKPYVHGGGGSPFDTRPFKYTWMDTELEAGMIDRRTLLGLAPAAVASCARSEGAYFGSTALPQTRRLVHTLGGEIESLDPAKSTGSWEFYVIPALFEGLTQYHPELPTPMAALATHYEANADSTQFRFYLRGHPAPRGVRLPSSADLPEKFTRGRRALPDSVPAYWSDGHPITAYDFVYSWRRFVDPQTAAPLAFQFIILKNAREVISGKRPPEDLGVRALDDFTFAVDLRSSTSFFLEFITSYVYSAVPSHAVEAARKRNSGVHLDLAILHRVQRSLHAAGSSAKRTNRPRPEPALLRRSFCWLGGAGFPACCGRHSRDEPLQSWGRRSDSGPGPVPTVYSGSQPQEGLSFAAGIRHRLSVHQHTQSSL